MTCKLCHGSGRLLRNLVGFWKQWPMRVVCDCLLDTPS